MKYLFLVASFFYSLFCYSQTGIEQHYKIYNTHTRQLTTPEQIAIDCKDANVLFFGEEHNDSAGHYMERVIFEALHRQYNDRVALSLEMFETDNQTALNDYLGGFIPEDRLAKDTRLWSNYKDYRPMIEYAKKNSIAVIAANPPRRYVSMVSRRGMRSLDSLSKAAKQFLPPLPYDTLTGRYRE
ncbi:MAG: ChaN family lipoprotein, partial [Bacteroidota bacterium]